MEVIKINAIWCSACLIMNEVWNSVLKEETIKTTTLDYDLDEEEVSKYNPGNILPVFIFIKNNQEVKRTVGELKKEEMLKIIKELHDEENS